MLQSTDSESGENWSQLVALTRETLENLYNPGHLQTSPLLSLLGLGDENPQDAALALRNLLREGIESLRPPASIPVNRPEWLDYRLLSMTYIQARNSLAVCQELGISRTTFYRRREEALLVLAQVLWKLTRRQNEVSDDATVEPSSPVARQANRMAQHAPLQPVNLGEILQAALRLVIPVATAEGISIEVHIEKELPTIPGDPASLRQILLNLLTTAIKFATGKQLVLSARLIGDETLWCLQGLDAHKVSEKVPEETAGYKVSSVLLETYGGKLACHRTGSTISLKFTIPGSKSKSILIVDDDPDTIRLYRQYLQGRDYSAQVARSGQEAKARMAESVPDLIILDVLMPHEDGWDILQYLKSTPGIAHVPVIVCSVLDQPQLALHLGAVEVLQKPIAEEAFVQAIAAALPLRSEAGENQGGSQGR